MVRGRARQRETSDDRRVKRCSNTYDLRHAREFGMEPMLRSWVVCAGRTQPMTGDKRGTVKIVIGRAKFALLLLLLNASLLSVSRNSNAITDPTFPSMQNF